HHVRLFTERAGGELALGGLKRIVELGMHEHAAHDVGNEDARTVPGLIEAGAAPGRSDREVCRPKEAMLARREVERLALVPDVVAGGNDIGARVERRLEDLLGYAKPASGVFAVDDDKIEPEVGDQAGKAFPYRRPPGTPHHVATQTTHDGA